MMAELDIIEVTKLLRLTRTFMQKNTDKHQRKMVKYFDDYTIDDKTDQPDSSDEGGDIGIKSIVKNPPQNFKNNEDVNGAIESITRDKDNQGDLNHTVVCNLIKMPKNGSAPVGGTPL